MPHRCGDEPQPYTPTPPAPRAPHRCGDELDCCERGLWGKGRVHAVENCWITAEENKEITGEDYET